MCAHDVLHRDQLVQCDHTIPMGNTVNIYNILCAYSLQFTFIPKQCIHINSNEIKIDLRSYYVVFVFLYQLSAYKYLIVTCIF